MDTATATTKEQFLAALDQLILDRVDEAMENADLEEKIQRAFVTGGALDEAVTDAVSDALQNLTFDARTEIEVY